MESSDRVFSAPLQQLKNEHVALRADMDSFYEIAEDLEYRSGPVVAQLFAQLYERVAAFAIALKAHSTREEIALFPMMARRLGAGDRTIEAMESEHEKAEQHLRDFLAEAEHAGKGIAEDDAQTITVYAVQAYATLTQHFAKEEKMLFPLAESILTTEEKAELEQVLSAAEGSIRPI
jgi:regulator of cell morphogenesis and NO signaling